MENFKKLLRFAKMLELKYIIAQKVSAQAGDIEQALKGEGVWDLANQVSPLVDAAKVPSDASVQIELTVSPGPVVNFVALINPSNPKVAQTLLALLIKNFSNKMTAALKKSGLNVDSEVRVKWLTF